MQFRLPNVKQRSRARQTRAALEKGARNGRSARFSNSINGAHNLRHYKPARAKRSGRERAITNVPAKTWRRCCGTFRATHLPLLDFGCGPGRDLKSLRRTPVTSRSASRRAALRRDGGEHSRDASGGYRIFSARILPDDHFLTPFSRMRRAVFTCQRRVAARAAETARFSQAGAASLQFRYRAAMNEEGWEGDGRYGVFHAPKAGGAMVCRSGLCRDRALLSPAGLPREEQRWFASVWRRQDA